MKRLLTIALAVLLSAAAFGQVNRLSADIARADSVFAEASREAMRVALLRTAVARAAAEATAQCASELARIIDCSKIERLYDKPRIIHIPKRNKVCRGYPVRIVIIANYDSQTNASHYQLKYIKYSNRQYQ